MYDSGGRLVRVLVDGHWTAGEHAVAWDGRDAGGREVASGVYFFELRGTSKQTGRAVLLR